MSKGLRLHAGDQGVVPMALAVVEVIELHLHL
jgi:hypothetical protein